MKTRLRRKNRHSSRKMHKNSVVCRDKLKSLDKHKVSYCFNVETEIWGEKPRIYCHQGVRLQTDAMVKMLLSKKAEG